MKPTKSNVLRNDFDIINSLFYPKTIAVIGVSQRAESLGRTILENLKSAKYRGKIYLIHPNLQALDGFVVHRNLSDIPTPVDLAVIVLPRSQVGKVLISCGQAKVKNVLLITAGYSEVGNLKDERALTQIAQRYGFGLIGPNCMGLMNTENNLNATFSPLFPRAGDVAMISQSGSVGQVLLEYCESLGFGISKFISIGNQAGWKECDLLAYLGKDVKTKFVLLYLEKISDAKKFVRIAKKSLKPTLALLGCVSARERKKLEYLCRLAGIAVATDLNVFFGMASMMVLQPNVKGRRLGVITNAGGPGLLAHQKATALGIRLPPLTEKAKKSLRRILPAEAIVQNPLDILATATAEDYQKSLEVLLGQKNLDVILIIFVTPANRQASEVVQCLLPLIEKTKPNKTILTCFVMGKGRAKLLQAFGSSHLPIFSFPEDAVAALAGFKA